MTLISNLSNNPKVLGAEPRSVSRVIAQDAGAIIPEGAVLGEISLGTPTSAAKSGGNTGNGTLTTLTLVEGARVGVYAVRVIEVAANVARFQVMAPDGNQIGTGIVAGAAGTFVFENEIRFTLTDGGTDFIVGDGFDVTVPAGSGRLVRSVSTATDGSKLPRFVTTRPIDARAGIVTTDVVFDGTFVESYVVFTGSETLDTLVWGQSFRQRLESAGIKLLKGNALFAQDNN